MTQGAASAGLPEAGRIQRAVEATWPPRRTWQKGPWTFRDGAGGGKRVSAVTARAPVDAGDIRRAIASCRAHGTPALFQVRPGEAALDAALADAGLGVLDPVTLYAAAVAALTTEPPQVAAPGDAPQADQVALWAQGGIDAGRLAVMARAPRPSACLGVRRDGALAATAFVACDGALAMLHALDVAPAARRQGAGRALMAMAAGWAAAQGARHLGLVVLRSNAPARALYASLGMAAVGEYHYRREAEP